MQEVIEKAYVNARRQWHGVASGALADYAAHVARLGTAPEDLERHGADIFLALACGRADPAALRLLEEQFIRPMEERLARSGFDISTREDVLQQLRLHLCTGEAPRILTYAGRASLSSWLHVAGLRFALNLQASAERMGQPQPDVVLERLLDDRTDLERQWAANHARPLFQAALEKAIGKLTERERTLLRLCYLDGLSIDAIGQLHRVHRATAARWLAAIRRRILDDVSTLLAHESGLHASEFESLAWLVRSKLHLSLRRVLGAA